MLSAWGPHQGRKGMPRSLQAYPRQGPRNCQSLKPTFTPADNAAVDRMESIFPPPTCHRTPTETSWSCPIPTLYQLNVQEDSGLKRTVFSQLLWAALKTEELFFRFSWESSFPLPTTNLQRNFWKKNNPLFSLGTNEKPRKPMALQGSIRLPIPSKS